MKKINQGEERSLEKWQKTMKCIENERNEKGEQETAEGRKKKTGTKKVGIKW